MCCLVLQFSLYHKHSAPKNRNSRDLSGLHAWPEQLRGTLSPAGVSEKRDAQTLLWAGLSDRADLESCWDKTVRFLIL